MLKLNQSKVQATFLNLQNMSPSKSSRQRRKNKAELRQEHLMKIKTKFNKIANQIYDLKYDQQVEVQELDKLMKHRESIEIRASQSLEKVKNMTEKNGRLSLSIGRYHPPRQITTTQNQQEYVQCIQFKENALQNKNNQVLLQKNRETNPSLKKSENKQKSQKKENVLKQQKTKQQKKSNKKCKVENHEESKSFILIVTTGVMLALMTFLEF